MLSHHQNPQICDSLSDQPYAIHKHLFTEDHVVLVSTISVQEKEAQSSYLRKAYRKSVEKPSKHSHIKQSYLQIIVQNQDKKLQFPEK